LNRNLFLQLRILFEDNHLIAVHKQSGEPVQPEVGKPQSVEEQVKEYIKVTKQKPGDVFLGVIHRLDMPVSGIVLFAKTSKALVRMNEAFKQRNVEKIYTAVVNGIPDPKNALITHFLLRDDNRRITKAFDEVIRVQGKNAILKIALHTGRKHQIRAQLSKIGFPIVGDVKYNAPKPLEDGGIALCATRLAFIHPVTKEKIVIETDF
jgi:23S rRNA pseudouridine1911/1915/1917 synthase